MAAGIRSPAREIDLLITSLLNRSIQGNLLAKLKFLNKFNSLEKHNYGRL